MYVVFQLIDDSTYQSEFLKFAMAAKPGPSGFCSGKYSKFYYLKQFLVHVFYVFEYIKM